MRKGMIVWLVFQNLLIYFCAQQSMWFTENGMKKRRSQESAVLWLKMACCKPKLQLTQAQLDNRSLGKNAWRDDSQVQLQNSNGKARI